MTEAWAPDLTEVGSRCPTKTRDQTAAAGTDVILGTFNDKTVPTDTLAEPIVTGAVAVVANAVGTIGVLLYPLAKDAAAWRAAADIELAYPERDADITLYEQLDRRAQLALTRLINAADDTGTGADGTLPQYAFPDPVPWGDQYL
jgi:hypothetical protein